MRFFAALTDLFALSFFSFFNGGGFFRFRSRLLSRSLARRELWLRGFEQRFGKIVLAGLQLLLFYTVYGKQKLVSWHDAVGVEAVFWPRESICGNEGKAPHSLKRALC